MEKCCCGKMISRIPTFETLTMLSFLKHHFLNPLKELLHDSKTIGIGLLCCTVVSLLLSNYSLTNINYIHFWNNSFVENHQQHLRIGIIQLPNSILQIINDFLMTIFFFAVAMEIKREIVDGELSSTKKAALPVFAAFGGMIVPAIIFLFITKNTYYTNGWAIPTATDIAFTIGIASMLGKRIPNNLKIFLMALAIIDDLGAIVVIAFFYGSTIHWIYLILAAAIMIVLYVLNKLRFKFGVAHFMLGLILWYCIFNSGIHATIAGVAFGAIVPKKFLQQFEIILHNWVYFLILPLFVLANTAITISSNFSVVEHQSLFLGIVLGLVVGKPLGIFLICFMFTKFKVVNLPENVSYKTLLVGATLAGIGFTMSIFIATLAYNNLLLQDVSKMATLIASALAAIIGVVVALIYLPKIQNETS